MQSKTPEQHRILIQMIGCSWLENRAVTHSLSGSVPARRMLQPGNWPQWADLHVSNSPLHIWLLSLTAGGHHRHRLSSLICSLSLCNTGCTAITAKLRVQFKIRYLQRERVTWWRDVGHSHVSAVCELMIFKGFVNAQIREIGSTARGSSSLWIQQSRFMNVIMFTHKHTKTECKSHGTWAHLLSLDTHCYIIGFISYPHRASPSMWRSRQKKSTLIK